MKYVLMVVLMILAGCSDDVKTRTGPFLQEAVDACQEINTRLGGEGITFKEETHYGEPAYVCGIKYSKSGERYLYGEEIMGALIAMRMVHNKPLQPKMDVCMAKNKCSEYGKDKPKQNLGEYLNCRDKCTESLGYIRL